MNKKYIIGIDLGGTKMLTGLLNRHFEVRETSKQKTEPSRGSQHFFKTIQKSVENVLEDARVDLKSVGAIGVGCPGIISVETGKVVLSPNIPFLDNCPLKSKLEKLFKVPVAVENDVNAGLYGEYRLGAAQGYRHIVGIFLGTGVGGALILNGELYRGATGAAGEIGHTFLDCRAALGGALSQSTLENLTGRLSIAQEAAGLAIRQKAPALFKSAGTDIAKMKSGALALAVRGGDKALQRLIADRARVLGIAMANVVNLLSPELIVLGGGLVEALGDKIVKEAEKTMREFAMGPLVKRVKVASARLSDYAIVKGAAKLAEDKLKGKRR